jgi:formylglycine-generating enzyme required for sulfatase activity
LKCCRFDNNRFNVGIGIMKRRMILSIIVAMMIAASTFGVGVEAADKAFTNPAIRAEFVLIVPGTFMMGDTIQHQVVIGKPFYMQVTEVTQGQWRTIMGNNPSSFKDCGDDCPVENVSWIDALEFIRKLNQMEGTDRYRLPTEAEWEYACRAGSTMVYSFGGDKDELGDYAWYDKNSGNRTHPVAKKKPNAWGLYDMYGNVWEWCQDGYDDYPLGMVKDPKGTSTGQHRVLRGGSWLDSAGIPRSAFRGEDYPVVRSSDIGFRLVRSF